MDLNKWATFLLVFIALFVISLAQEPSCCEKTKGSCHGACKQLSLVTLSEQPDEESRARLLGPIHSHCPRQLRKFWGCMNRTIADLVDGANWEGRQCCSLAQTRHCQLSCLTAQRASDLVSGCRRSDESAVYQCLERQEEFEDCCRQSDNPDCAALCKGYLRKSFPASDRDHAKRRLDKECRQNPLVLNCVANLTQSSPVQDAEKNLPCCSRGRNLKCQQACIRALKSGSSDQAIMETLMKSGCGSPMPDDKLWQCFLQNAEPKGTELPSKIDRLGMDAAKLHCCNRASSVTCRRLCHNTYSREWTGSWSDLDRICLSSPAEAELKSCVDEVEEPCEMGCEGLNFCSAFNNRPSELFRRCNPAADIAAQEQYEQWRHHRYIPVSETMKLPLKNLDQCAPEKWKSVACIVHLKPCHPKTHVSQICRSDCVSLLHECVDFDRLSGPGAIDVTSICELLSPPPGQPCISVGGFAQVKNRNFIDSRRMDTAVGFPINPEITRPCQSSPCNATEHCAINRQCHDGSNCPSYTCQPSCSLGEVSKLSVPLGTWVRVPTHHGLGSQRICRCGSDGRMEKCKLMKTESLTPCWLGRTHIEHGKSFWLECNHCTCRSGELICSKNKCTPEEKESKSFFGTGNEISLPCDCPRFRHPVCGSNGKTYMSACLAKCSGLSDAEIKSGSCDEHDPCKGVNCGNGRQCVRTKKICLIPNSRKCLQFQCVPLKCENTWEKDTEKVCDTNGREHSSVCRLASAGAMLAYSGSCLRPIHCSTEGPICGIDGEIYPSECAAEAQGIPRDYSGPCRFISKHDGMHMKVLYSPAEVAKIMEATGSQFLTVEDISQHLSYLVQTAQCRVGVYLGIGAELVVVVRPVSRKWTNLQLQVCASETVRLAALINQRNPMFQVDASLSVLTSATVNHGESSSGHTLNSKVSNSSTLFTVLIVTLTMNIFR